MKTCTPLYRALLLVVMLAVSCAAAAPDDNPQAALQGFLNTNPFTPHPYNHPPFNHYPFSSQHHYPGSYRVIVVDPYSVVSFFANNERWADQQDSAEASEEEQGEHGRSKRQATFGYGMQRGPYGRDHRASAGYNRNFNFGINFSHRFRR